MPRNYEQPEAGNKSEIECARANHVTSYHLSGVLLNGIWHEPRSSGVWRVSEASSAACSDLIGSSCFLTHLDTPFRPLVRRQRREKNQRNECYVTKDEK